MNYTAFARFPVASRLRVAMGGVPAGTKFWPSVFHDSLPRDCLDMLLRHTRTKRVASTRDGSLAVGIAPNGDCILRAHLSHDPVGAEVLAEQYSGLSFGCNGFEVSGGRVNRIIGLTEVSLVHLPKCTDTFVLLFEGHRTDWLGWR